eukprot:TRINITY_DN79896_c0_g1_i1.p1 TRINITY_DN79896_c0_g1~~TRINITY_DN79896_c0_g1_i1.p1  ORF type:complete len:520 (+),score=61.37 TRINITY_DN79896_c0_g1_i1:36-1562(+)
MASDKAQHFRSVTPRRAAKRIANGQSVLKRLRWRLALTMLALGSVLSVIYEVLYYHKFLGILASLKTCSGELEAFLYILLAASLNFGRFLIYALAPLADDIWVTRFVLCLDFLTVFSADAMRDAKILKQGHSPKWLARSVAYTSCDIVFFLGCLRAMVFTSGLRMQEYMWKVFRLWLFLLILTNVCSSTAWVMECGRFSATFGFLPPKVLLLVLASRPALIQGCRSRLNAAVINQSEERAAAGIAGMVGNCSVKDIMVQASHRFRSVELAEICLDDVRVNRPNPTLFGRSISETWRECDAFVSHSWHDDASAKWKCMQRWRNAFIAANGREPRVWFDKCCIDQNNIECDLRCLPVFLSACKTMVVFCGVTYLSRLWCIIELFTFVHMGRGFDKIYFQFVLREGLEAHDHAIVENAFRTFDAQRCDCSDPRDKERMLGIIHTAYGGMASFNQEVRDILGRVRDQDGEASVARPASSSDESNATQSPDNSLDSGTDSEDNGEDFGPVSSE